MLQSVPTVWPVRRVTRLIGGALVISSCLLAFGLPALAQAAKGDAAASPKKGQPLLPVQIRYGTDGLPRPVLDLREALQAAVEAGRIEELAQTYAETHIAPDIGAAEGADPAAHWKRLSGDGQGREVLAALSLILEAGYAEIRARGRHREQQALRVALFRRDAVGQAHAASGGRAVAPGAGERGARNEGEGQVHPLAARHRRRRNLARAA